MHVHFKGNCNAFDTKARSIGNPKHLWGEISLTPHPGLFLGVPDVGREPMAANNVPLVCFRLNWKWVRAAVHNGRHLIQTTLPTLMNTFQLFMTYTS